MSTMLTAETTVAPRSSGPFTRADLERTPPDGRRYEIIDGTLLVTSAPGFAHQSVVGNLHLLLRAACPSELRVLLAPFAVALAEDTELQPDLLVAPLAQFTAKELPGAPLLAVEVLSPSTSRIDRLVKRERFEQEGLACFWLVDPLTPSIVVLEHDGTALREVARASGDEQLDIARPFPVTVVPSALLA